MKWRMCHPTTKITSASTTKSARSLQGSDALSMAPSMGLTDTRKQKLCEGLKLVFVVTPPIATVIFLSVYMMIKVGDTLASTTNMTNFLNQSQLINQLVTTLQRERGMTCVLLTSQDNTNSATAQLTTYRYDTNDILTQIEPFWSELIQPQDQADMSSFVTFTASLANHRNSIGGKIHRCEDNLNYYTPRIDVLIYNSGRVFYGSDDGKFWGSFDALRMVLVASEMLGLKRATGGSFFAQGYFSEEMYRYFIEISGAADRYLALAGMADQSAKEMVDQQRAMLNDTTSYIQIMMLEILANKSSPDISRTRSTVWFNNMTQYTDTIVKNTRDMLNNKLATVLNQQAFNSQITLYIGIASCVCALLICIPITIYFSIQTAIMRKKVKEKVTELNFEKRRSEQILFQMMPKEIAKELTAGRTVVPRMFAECTVYFSDIKGFTNICSSSTPLQVVDLLNALYTVMDNVLDRYSVYKVETIGDAYMVVSGIPKANKHEHSNQICTMALNMLKEIDNVVVPHRPKEKLKMRIGCNTGSCAAGIVGVKMPRYCLFGDTVNTASRMESTGLPMRIQLSESTANHLKDFHNNEGFITPFRGETTIKGKGAMRTYWLQSKATFPYTVDLLGDDPMFPVNCEVKPILRETRQDTFLYEPQTHIYL